VVGPATSMAQPVTHIVGSECDDKEGAGPGSRATYHEGKGT
jgi:hypothetical protein